MTDIDDVLRSLGLPPADTAARVTSGYDSTLWRVRVAGAELAVRLLPERGGLDTELAMMAAAASRDVPVPHVVASGHHEGHGVIAMTWCPGRTIAEDLVAGAVAGAEIDVLGRAFGRAHAALHRPDASGRSLCHGDYHPLNVLTDGRAVTGVVDWSQARLGDPRSDVAATLVVLRLAPAIVGVPTDGFTAAWQDGYRELAAWPGTDELRPFVRAAAAEQDEVWARRLAAGEAPATVADAARAIARDA